jgi:hypothetical protein
VILFVMLFVLFVCFLTRDIVSRTRPTYGLEVERLQSVPPRLAPYRWQ